MIAELFEFIPPLALIGAIIFLAQEAGVPVPLPGNLLIAFLGQRAGWNADRLLVTVLAVTIAISAGFTLIYYLGDRFAPPHTSEALGERASKLIHRLGPASVVVARYIPGLRIPVFLAAGALDVPFWPSLALTALHTAAITSVIALIAARSGSLGAHFFHPSPVTIACAIIPTAISLAVLAWLRRRLQKLAPRPAVAQTEAN